MKNMKLLPNKVISDLMLYGYSSDSDGEYILMGDHILVISDHVIYKIFNVSL